MAFKVPQANGEAISTLRTRISWVGSRDSEAKDNHWGASLNTTSRGRVSLQLWGHIVCIMLQKIGPR